MKRDVGVAVLKVTEAYTFLTSKAEDRQEQSGLQKIVSAMRVVDAMDRSCGSESWEVVSVPHSAAGATPGVRDTEGEGA